MSEEHPTPRAIDVVLSYRVVESLRDAAIAKISAEIPNLRQGDDTRRVDILTAAVTTLRMLDIDAVLGELRAEIAPEETEAFEAAAKVSAFNVQKVGGDFIHPITKRAHALWHAAVRWHQLREATNAAPARRENDNQQQGENQ